MFVNKLSFFQTAFPYFRILLSVLFLFSIFILLFFFYTRGFIPHDEGWIVNPAQRIVTGEIPYRDFYYIYTPGVAYVIAVSFHLFGQSIIVSRLVTLLIALLSIYILFKLTQIVSPKFLAFFPVSLIFLVWGPLHINFAWPVMYAIFGGVLTCWMLFLTRKHAVFFFLAGVTTGLTILFKQNFGLALLLNNLVFFVFNKQNRTKKTLLFYHCGVLFLPVIVCVCFLANNALIPFIDNMYFFMIEQIIFNNHQSTPFIYPDLWYRQIAKGLLYLLPLMISIFASILLYKRDKRLVFLTSFSGVYYLLGIRPTTDYMHFVPLLSLSGIPFLVTAHYLKRTYLRLGLSLFIVVLISFGFYSALFRNYYRWNTPLIQQNISSSNTRLGVLTDNHSRETISEIDTYIRTYKTNDYIFIYSFSPSFYLLTNTKNPTKYIFAPPQLLSDEDEKEIISDLQIYKVSLIITDTTLDGSTPYLTTYIQRTYKEVKKIHNYTIWRK